MPNLLKKVRNRLMWRIWGKCGNMSDENYLRMVFFLAMGRPLHLKNPKTFNEKLQWLKLYAYKPEYAMMVDKYRVKEYVANIIGEEHVIPVYGVWDRAEDIDFDNLPDRFVLKCNHDCGGMVICKDKSKLDRVEARRKLNECLLQDYSRFGRDKPYRDVKRCIFAEKYMEDSKTGELRDYKFFCFDGKVKALLVATDRQKEEGPYIDFYDTSYNHLDIRQEHPNSPIPPERPQSFEQMKLFAEKLSQGIPHIRVDFYEIDGQLYFGELTFYSAGGFVPFHPASIDYEWGQWINLPAKSDKR